MDVFSPQFFAYRWYLKQLFELYEATICPLKILSSIKYFYPKAFLANSFFKIKYMLGLITIFIELSKNSPFDGAQVVASLKVKLYKSPDVSLSNDAKVIIDFY